MRLEFEQTRNYTIITKLNYHLFVSLQVFKYQNCLKPRYYQRVPFRLFCNFILLKSYAFLLGMVVNGFVNVVITTIERRFGLRSSQTGLIAGGYDIASFLTLVPVSYLGGRSKASKPRCVYIYINTYLH